MAKTSREQTKQFKGGKPPFKIQNYLENYSPGGTEWQKPPGNKQIQKWKTTNSKIKNKKALVARSGKNPPGKTFYEINCHTPKAQSGKNLEQKSLYTSGLNSHIAMADRQQTEEVQKHMRVMLLQTN